MSHKALQANESVLCRVINKYGDSQQAYAEKATLPYFTRPYVAECMACAVRAALTPELIRKEYRNKPGNWLYGHCCHASVALYLLLGGKENGYTIWKNTDADGVLHYWLTDDLRIVDPTAAQYLDFGKHPPYEGGKRVGYQLSNSVKTIIDRVFSTT